MFYKGQQWRRWKMLFTVTDNLDAIVILHSDGYGYTREYKTIMLTEYKCVSGHGEASPLAFGAGPEGVET